MAERERVTRRNHFLELIGDNAAGGAERQIDGVGSTDKERATCRRRGM